MARDYVILWSPDKRSEKVEKNVQYGFPRENPTRNSSICPHCT